MPVTIESTASDDVAIRLLLPSALAARVLAYEDELQHLQAKSAIRTQAMRQVKIDTAQGKDEALQAATRKVLERRRITLMPMHWKERASFIRDRLENAPVDWGLPADYADTAREKDIRVIREVLHVWEKLNGLSYKSRQPD